jgi:hypothetical protein
MGDRVEVQLGDRVDVGHRRGGTGRTAIHGAQGAVADLASREHSFETT